MKILLATDGSDFSRSAIDEGCRIAQKTDGAQIRIISVAETIILATEPFALSEEYINEISREAEARAESTVAAAEAQVRELIPEIGGRLTTVVRSGLPKKCIVEEAETWNADLVIVGSHGYGFWKRTFIGSVSDGVLHHAPCSVMVVRSTTAEHAMENRQ